MFKVSSARRTRYSTGGAGVQYARKLSHCRYISRASLTNDSTLYGSFDILLKEKENVSKVKETIKIVSKMTCVM
jgi:hypothetical protein